MNNRNLTPRSSILIFREREKKERFEREQREAEIEEEREILERKRKAEAEKKIKEWMEKKRIQAEEKFARMNEMKKKLIVDKKKPKEYKKAINFQDWINLKNQNCEVDRKRRDEEQNRSESRQQSRESVANQSYNKWIRAASTKAKPVPLCQGLESLRGSSTKIYTNPEPWVGDWE